MLNYWKPADAFVGDCMPFYHQGRFHLYYLRDAGHHFHPIAGALGGHEWAHRSSADLIHWVDEPLALPLDFAAGERSNCTGSFFPFRDKILAFYALRSAAFAGERYRWAESSDGGITFRKMPPTEPDAPPPSFGPSFRDPCVFQLPDGSFHMLITSNLAASPRGADGALLHYRSDTPSRWDGTPELLLRTTADPECPDYFHWNGFYYLLYSINAETRYLYSRQPLGGWSVPANDVLCCPRTQVSKTAPFGTNRRLAVGFVGTFEKQAVQYGGRAVFRELRQNPDGTLAIARVPELEPIYRPHEALPPIRLAAGIDFASEARPLPPDHCRLRGRCRAERTGRFGLFLLNRRDEIVRTVEFDPASRTVSLDRGRSVIRQVEVLEREFELEVVKFGDVLEVVIDRTRIVISPGDRPADGEARFFTEGGDLTVEELVCERFSAGKASEPIREDSESSRVSAVVELI